jgi:hypothetical protein
MDLDAAIAVLMAQIIDQMQAQAYPADLAPQFAQYGQTAQSGRRRPGF